MTRTDILNYLILHNNYKSYLEIGVFNEEHNFKKIKCQHKIGVDPNGCTTYSVTSDEFFTINDITFDLIFIDGLHLENQVDKDIKNSLQFLNPKGAIVLHDCLPESEWHQREEYGGDGLWCGTVWRSIAKLRMSQTNLEIRVVNTDYGCGILKVGKNIPYPQTAINYSLYESQKQNLLNVISVQEFKAMYGHS